MTVRQRVATSEDGRPLLIKSAPAGPAADRLGHEAALLALAAHPGVITVVADRESADGGRELHLAIAGARTAADLDVDLVGVAGLVAALATTAAELHELGVVHGRIGADHVVIDRDGRPILCGLAGAAPIGVVPWGGTAPLHPADDVAGIGRLLAGLVERATGSGDARGAWGWRVAAGGGRVAAQLRAIAAEATGADPPTAAELADAVLAAVPAARLPEPAGAGAGSGRVIGRRPAPVDRWSGVLRWLGLDTFDRVDPVDPVDPVDGTTAAVPSRPPRAAGDAGTVAVHRPTAARPDGPSARSGRPGAGGRRPGGRLAAAPRLGVDRPDVAASRRLAAVDGVAPGSGADTGGPAPTPGGPGVGAGRRPAAATTDGRPALRARRTAGVLAGPAGAPGPGPRRSRPLVAVPAPAATDGPGRSRRAVPVLAVLGLGLLAFGVGGLLRPSGPGSPSVPAAPEPELVAVPSASRGSATTLAPAAGSISSVDSAAGAIVQVDGARYAVGTAGDVLAIGDWDCDGTATVAVVRPTTGEVFVFDGWATADRPATAALAAEVPGASSAAGVDPDGDGCPALVVTDAAGATTEVHA